MQPLWKMIWQFLKKLNLKLPYDSEILLLHIYPREWKTYVYTQTITVVFIKAKKWNNINVYALMKGQIKCNMFIQ